MEDLFSLFYLFLPRLGMNEAPLSSFSRRQLSSLPEFYKIIFQVWQSLDGRLAGDELCIAATSATPLPVERHSCQFRDVGRY